LGQAPSLYVQAVDDSNTARVRILAENGQYHITDPDTHHPLVRELTGFSADIAQSVVQQLEHIARWLAVVELQAPANSQIPSNAVAMELTQDGQTLTSPSITLLYQQQGERWNQPTFQLKLTNQWERPLYCTVLDLTERYAINPGLFEAGGVWLQPGETAWAMGGKPLYASVPKEMWDDGVTEYRDIFKLIVSTAEFDARLLAQDSLDAPRRCTVTPSIGRQLNGLDRLMQRLQTRDIGATPENDSYDDWTTCQQAVITVRPRQGLPIPAVGEPISLGAGVKVSPHPTLSAKAPAHLSAPGEPLPRPTYPAAHL
jgi:hypothetical protein